MQQTKTLKELAEYLGGTVRGEEGCRVNGLAPLEAAGAPVTGRVPSGGRDVAGYSRNPSKL